MTHIVVGGAGIGGMTAALALSKAGVSVAVLERRPRFEEIGAGLQLAPNATRILERLGLLDAIRACATEPQAIRIRRARDGADLVSLPLGADARRNYGAPFLVVHRADLQRVLAEHVTASSLVTVTFDTHVARVKPMQQGVAVIAEASAAPATLEADGFVDAGGLRGSAENVMALRDSNRVAWRALVPATAVAARYAIPETNLWLGPSQHLVHYPLRGGSLVNIVAITEKAATRQRPHGDFWSEQGDPDELRRSFRDWHSDAKTLIESASRWQRWPLVDRSYTRRWTNGASTLLGDAAHPMLPFLAQGASQAIEDADALAWALSQPGDVPHAFATYEERRHARAARVQRASRHQGEIYHLGRPASDARDLAMRWLGAPRAMARMDWLYREPRASGSGRL